MITLAQIREFCPQYDDMSDYEITEAMHRTRAPESDFREFAQAFGGPLEEDKLAIAWREYNQNHPDEQLSREQFEDYANPGFMGKVWNSAKAIGEGITRLPSGIAGVAKDTWYGGNDIDVENDRSRIEDWRERQKDSAEYQKEWDGRVFEGIPGAVESAPYSLAALGPAVAGMAIAPVSAGVGAAIGAAGGGVTAYRATKEEYMQRLLQATEENLGRHATQEEWNKVAAKFEADAIKYGLWEAVPEALGNIVFAKLLGPLGAKTFKDGFIKLAGRYLGAQAEEQTTETITGWGQGGLDADAGLRDKAPTWGEAFMEQAPNTFWLTNLMGAGHKAAGLAYNRIAGRFQERQIEEAQEPDVEALLKSIDPDWNMTHETPANGDMSEFNNLHGLGPAWREGSRRDVELGRNWNREEERQRLAREAQLRAAGYETSSPKEPYKPAARQTLGQDGSISIINPFGNGEIAFQEPGQQWTGARLAQGLEGADLNQKLSEGQGDIDLLAEIEKQQARGQIQGDPLANYDQAEVARLRGLGVDDQVILDMFESMAGQSSTQPANQPVLQSGVQPVQPQIQTAGPVISQGLSSQAIPLGPAVQPMPQAMPGQGQITNTQASPRADTQSQAKALGLPAPQALPQSAMPQTPESAPPAEAPQQGSIQSSSQAPAGASIPMHPSYIPFGVSNPMGLASNPAPRAESGAPVSAGIDGASAPDQQAGKEIEKNEKGNYFPLGYFMDGDQRIEAGIWDNGEIQIGKKLFSKEQIEVWLAREENPEIREVLEAALDEIWQDKQREKYRAEQRAGLQGAVSEVGPQGNSPNEPAEIAQGLEGVEKADAARHKKQDLDRDGKKLLGKNVLGRNVYEGSDGRRYYEVDGRLVSYGNAYGDQFTQDVIATPEQIFVDSIFSRNRERYPDAYLTKDELEGFITRYKSMSAKEAEEYRRQGLRNTPLETRRMKDNPEYVFEHYARELPMVGSFESGVIHKTENQSVRDAAKQWVEKNIQSPVETEIGEVEFTARDMQESLSHGFSGPKIDAIPAVAPTLEKGSYLGAKSDKDGKPVENYYFAARAIIGGKEKVVFARVRKRADSKKRFYVHEVFTEEEILEASGNLRATDQDQSFHSAADFYKNLIAEYLKVKEGEQSGRENLSEDEANLLYDQIHKRLNERLRQSLITSPEEVMEWIEEIIEKEQLAQLAKDDTDVVANKLVLKFLEDIVQRSDTISDMEKDLTKMPEVGRVGMGKLLEAARKRFREESYDFPAETEDALLGREHGREDDHRRIEKARKRLDKIARENPDREDFKGERDFVAEMLEGYDAEVISQCWHFANNAKDFFKSLHALYEKGETASKKWLEWPEKPEPTKERLGFILDMLTANLTNPEGRANRLRYNEYRKEKKRGKKSHLDMARSELPLVGEFKSGVIHKTEDMSALQAAKEWISRHILEPVKRVLNGQEIEIIVDAKGVKNSLGHGMYPAKLDAVQAIEPVIQEGAYLHSLPDAKGHPIENHYFVGRARIGTEDKVIFLRTRQIKGQANRFYVHEIFTEEEIKEAGLNIRPSGIYDSHGNLISDSRLNSGERFDGPHDFYKNLIAEYLKVKEVSEQENRPEFVDKKARDEALDQIKASNVLPDKLTENHEKLKMQLGFRIFDRHLLDSPENKWEILAEAKKINENFNLGFTDEEVEQLTNRVVFEHLIDEIINVKRNSGKNLLEGLERCKAKCALFTMRPYQIATRYFIEDDIKKARGEQPESTSQDGQESKKPQSQWDMARSELPLVGEFKSGVIHKTEDMSALQAAKEWISRHILEPVKRVLNGQEIEIIVDAKGVKNSLGHAMYPAKLDAMQAIESVIQNGVYLGNLPDNANKPIQNYYFVARALIGKEEKVVFVRTRETQGQANRFYVHEVFTEDDIQKAGLNVRPSGIHGNQGEQNGSMFNHESRFDGPHDFYKNLIAEYLKVKEQDKGNTQGWKSLQKHFGVTTDGHKNIEVSVKDGRVHVGGHSFTPDEALKQCERIYKNFKNRGASSKDINRLVRPVREAADALISAQAGEMRDGLRSRIVGEIEAGRRLDQEKVFEWAEEIKSARELENIDAFAAKNHARIAIHDELAKAIHAEPKKGLAGLEGRLDRLLALAPAQITPDRMKSLKAAVRNEIEKNLRTEEWYKRAVTYVCKIEPGVISEGKGKSAIETAIGWIEENIASPVETEIGEVTVNGRSMKDSFGHGLSAEKLDAVQAIEPLLKNGIYAGMIPDYQNKTIENYFFIGGILLGDAERVMIARLRQKGEGNKKLYVHEVFTDEEIKEAGVTLRPTDQDQGFHSAADFYKNLIAEYLKVKEGNRDSQDNGTPGQTGVDDVAKMTRTQLLQEAKKLGASAYIRGKSKPEIAEWIRGARKEKRRRWLGKNEQGLDVFVNDFGRRFIKREDESEEAQPFVTERNPDSGKNGEFKTFSVDFADAAGLYEDPDTRKFLTEDELREFEGKGQKEQDTKDPAGSKTDNLSAEAEKAKEIKNGQTTTPEGMGVSGLQQGDRGGEVERTSGAARQPAGGRSLESGSENSKTGKETTIKIPNHPDAIAVYEVIELEDAQPSHLPEKGFAKNPQYELENERRYHGESASQANVLHNAQALEPAFLVRESIDANHGAPVVDKKGNVLGGNGRAMSLRVAYDKFPAKARAYIDALLAEADNLGIDRQAIESMQKPFLVRRLKGDFSFSERQNLVSALNDDFKKSKEKRSAGKSRGDRLSEKTLKALGNALGNADSLRAYFDESDSRKIVEMLIADGVFQETERNEYITNEGLLNPEGKKALEVALRGRVARSYEALSNLPESTVSKLDAAIPHILIAESIGGEWNITEYMREAIDLMVEYVNFKKNKSGEAAAIEVFFNQIDMISGASVSDRYSQKSQSLFLKLLDLKKKEFALDFARYASHAAMSDGGLVVNKTAREAGEAYLGFKNDLESLSRKDLLDLLSADLQAEGRKLQNNKLRSFVKKYLERPKEAVAEERSPADTDRDYGTTDSPNLIALSDHFAGRLLAGASWPAITQARKEAAGLCGGKNMPGSQHKNIDEAIELGVVKAARSLISSMRRDGKSDIEIFKALVELYRRQPVLGARTSESIMQQAYSTPAPLAFLASRLAGIGENTTIYEPTAGNGMLLIEATPENAIANELNEGRNQRLQSLGFGTVAKQDAADWRPSEKVDVVIANPPFGRVWNSDHTKTLDFIVDGFTTKELDQAIVLQSLGALKRGNNGRAVLIIGGKMATSLEERQKAYRAKSQVNFYRALYENYHVIDHFSINGDLYSRQGASYPIDIIVLDTNGTTAERGDRKYPGGEPPRVYQSFEGLEEMLHEQSDPARQSATSAAPGRLGERRNSESGRSDRTNGDLTGENTEGSQGSRGERSGEQGISQQSSPGNAGRTPGSRDGGMDRSRTDSRAGARKDQTRPHRGDAGGRLESAREDSLSGESTRGEVSAAGESGRGRGDGRDTGRSSVLGAMDAWGSGVAKADPVIKDTEFQTQYKKRSSLPSMGTLVPKNMATAIQKAFDRLEAQYGNIDEFVARELGYNVNDLGRYFAAEQVDAIGLALFNLKKGAGFIIGDQTGIGKGRVNAAIIRWAQRQGLTPVFITMNKQLYADMVRDLSDIGMEGFRPLPTDILTGKDAIDLPDGRKLKTRSTHMKTLEDVAQNGLGDNYDAIFTTYTQMDGTAGARRRPILMNLAPRALFILDESHNAGGGTGAWDNKQKQEPRGKFMRQLLERTPNGVFYSSATYAKRPEVMSLYNKTDMRLAVNDITSLADAINSGGIPLQQITASCLAEAGQYLRRERTWEGAEVGTEYVAADSTRANACAKAMRSILNFNRLKEDALKEQKNKAAGEGVAASSNSSADEGSMSTTNFASVMHNLINQLFLAQKVNAVIAAATAAIKRGEKPVIALSNTMGSAIADYADINGLIVGDQIDITMADMFLRYLVKTRTYTVKDKSKIIEQGLLTDEQLGPQAVAAYREAEKIIKSCGLDQLPVSFIDMIKQGLAEAGISCGEITGRSIGIDYSGSLPIVSKIDNSASDKIRAVNDFNSGKLDVVILNSAGSTGISLHASEKFKDQRRRCMIVAQADANIDVFMQTLGRIFRTGQVVPPKYQLLFTDIAAEKRPAAILAKKMASLNANTTAARDSDASFNGIPDFINKYGDAVAQEIIREIPDLHEKMGAPLDKKGKETPAPGDIIRKLTGYIPLLDVAEQKKVYEMLEGAYNDLIQEMDQAGTLDLEAKSLPLDAKLLREKCLKAAANSSSDESPFTRDVMVGEYDVKRLGKPYTEEEVRELVSKGKKIPLDEVDRKFADWINAKLQSMEDNDSRQRFITRTYEDRNKFRTYAQNLRPGYALRLKDKQTGEETLGVITGLRNKGRSINPCAMSDWIVDIALASPTKRMSEPLSRIASGTSIFEFEAEFDDSKFFKALNEGQHEKREKALFLTGNLLGAMELTDGSGRITFVETRSGEIMPAIRLRSNLSLEEATKNADIHLSPEQAIDFLDICRREIKTAMVSSGDGNLKITNSFDGYNFQVPNSKAKGGMYFLNGDLLKALGEDFRRRGQYMIVSGLSKERALSGLTALKNQGFGFVAGNNKDIAEGVVKGGAQTGKAFGSLKHGGVNKYGVPLERVTKINTPFTREEAREALKELAGMDLPNILEGLQAQVNHNQRDKLVSGAAMGKSLDNNFSRSEHFNLAAQIAEAWKWSAEQGIYEDKDGKDNIRIRRFVAALEINGEEAFAWLTIKETPEGLRIYSAELLNEEQLRHTAGREAENGKAFRARSYSEIIERLSGPVNAQASIQPGEFLSERKPGSMKKEKLTAIVEKLNGAAKNAAPCEAVQSFAELPEHLQTQFDGNETGLEGVYDPQSGKVWLVADNLESSQRAVEVWQHEQFVHHGLRSLLSDSERLRLMNQLWISLDGMANPLIKSIAENYGLNPRRNENDRIQVMEEVIARLAERHNAGLLTKQEQSLWQKIVAAVQRFLNQIAVKLGGKKDAHGYEQVEALLSALGKHVMEGLHEDNRDAYGIPTSRATDIDGSISLEELNRALLAVAKIDLYNEIENENTQINSAQRGKLQSKEARAKSWQNGFPKDAHNSAISKIMNIWKWAAKAGEEEHKSKFATDSNVIRYVARANLGGEKVFAWLTVKQSQAGLRLYSLELLKEKELRDKVDERLAFAKSSPFRSFEEIIERLSGPVKGKADKPLASLSPRKILGMNLKAAAKHADDPEIRHFFHEKDVSFLQNVIQLPHWLAKQYPEFAQIYERQLTRMDERQSALMKSLEQVPSLFGKARLGKEDKASLQKLVWELEGKEDGIKDIDKFKKDGEFDNGRAILAMNPDYYKAYADSLDNYKATAKAKAAMLEIRKSLDNDFLLAYNRMAEMREIDDSAIEDFRKSIGHFQNYFPHHRYGKYFVQAKDADGNVVYREHFDALTQGQAKRKALEIARFHKAEYPDSKWTDGINERLPDEILGAPIDSQAMEQIIKAATAKITDKEQAGKVRSVLSESVADVLKSRGWAGHSIKRKNVAGFEKEDIEKVLYDYKAGLNGWLTKIEAARDFGKMLGEIDARQKPVLWKYASQYIKDMLRNSDRIDRISGNIKSVAFAWYLGMNLKTAFVNVTQNMVVGVPRLQMDVTGGIMLWLKGARDSLVSAATGGKGSIADEQKLIQKLYEQKIITDAFMNEVRGHLQGVSGANIWNRFTKILGLPMSIAERFNRTSLALAAYRAAMSGKLKQKAKDKYGIVDAATFEQAIKFATDIVRDSHFVYGKSNMPEFMRASTAGRIISPMYTFRTFSHNMLAMWLWALKTQGKEGAVFTAKSLGATMALGGITAFPLYATLMALFQAISGDDDDWTEEIRKSLPNSDLLRDLVCYGAPALAGANIGGSLKMETPLTRGLIKGKDPKEILTQSVGEIIGIPYDLGIVRTSRVMEAYKHGNTWRAIEEAMPTFISNGMKAWRLYSEGETTMSGRPLNSPGQKGARQLNGAEAIGKFFGFQPVSMTKSYDSYSAKQRHDHVRSDEIDKLVVKVLKSRDSGDMRYQREAIKEMDAWNQKMKSEGKPGMMFNWKDIMRRVKSRRRENSQTAKERMKGAEQMAVWGL